MLRRLVELSLGSRGVVITLAVGLIIYGVFVTKSAKLDVFPDFVQPQVTVQTEAPGLAPEQVESLVTRPVGQPGEPTSRITRRAANTNASSDQVKAADP